MRASLSLALPFAVALSLAPASAQTNVRIGALSDMSSLYADIGGAGSVVAANIAANHGRLPFEGIELRQRGFEADQIRRGASMLETRRIE